LDTSAGGGGWRAEGKGEKRDLDGTGVFGKKGSTLNFIDVAHGAIRARTIEPGSVCERGGLWPRVGCTYFEGIITISSPRCPHLATGLRNPLA